MMQAQVLRQLNPREEQLIAHLDREVRAIFATMIGTDISQQQKTIMMNPISNDLVTATVKFVGSYNGMISMNTPQKLAIAFASLMLGVDISDYDDDVNTAIGDIVYTIGSSLKYFFEKNDHKVLLSMPSVTRGDEYLINTASNTHKSTLTYELNSEHFTVNILYKHSNK